jgi:hypothetical protein
MEILGADDGEELLWADLMGQGQAAETTVSREIPDYRNPNAVAGTGERTSILVECLDRRSAR